MGDDPIRDKETGYFTITNRIDGILNVSGHRMGTMETESALAANPIMAETAVVSRLDDMTNEAICTLVVFKHVRPNGNEAKQIANELRNWVGREIGPTTRSKDIRFDDDLPKTHSGRIMRHLLYSLARGGDITQDTSALENPTIFDQLKEMH